MRARRASTRTALRAVVYIVVILVAAFGVFSIASSVGILKLSQPNGPSSTQTTGSSSSSVTQTSTLASSSSTSSTSSSPVSSSSGGSTTTTTTTTSTSSQTTVTSKNTTTSTTTREFTLQIEAQLPNGTQVRGADVAVTSAQLPSRNYTVPSQVRLPEGTYSLDLSRDPSGALLFQRWNSTSSNSKTTSVQLNANVTIVALYKQAGPQTLSILGKDMQGKSVAGTIVDLYSSNGTKISTDQVPANFSVSYGSTYRVVADGNKYLPFKYWNGNQSQVNASRTVSITGNASLTAYYQALPPPYTPHKPGNYTVTVVAHTADGGELVGAYFQVRINGVFNHVADGYTPASVSVPAGSEEVVMYHCAQVPGCDNKFFVYRYYNNSAHTETRWQYFDLENDTSFSSYYDIMPASEAVHVTIQALNSTGPIFINCTCGSLVTINNTAGRAIAQSLEPYSFWLTKGENYTVTVGDLPGYRFVGWSTGSKSYTISFVAEPQTPDLYQTLDAMYVKT